MPLPRLETGVPNLDLLLRGGLPSASTTIVAGPPGSGKTILANQIAFRCAALGKKVLYFNTLSEPTAKTLLYLSDFSFFQQKELEAHLKYVDLSVLLQTKGLESVGALILDHIQKTMPALVVIDSFKVFDDLAKSHEELRKFSYDIAIKLMAWESTALFIGEYGSPDYNFNPLFSIVDGLVTLSHRASGGEEQRFLQVVKMRGTDHVRDECSFEISKQGITIYAPRQTLRRQKDDGTLPPARCKFGIPRLDDLLGEGIPRGSSLLVAGVAGTGKTVLLLEFIYLGAKLFDEKGILFSFEETEDRLRAIARGLGWNLDAEIQRGMVEIVFIAQPDIRVEANLQMMRERVEATEARRVAIDSASVFLHRLEDPQRVREKVFQLASIVQNTKSVGLFATDVPYGSTQISRHGVEETVVDGVILLTATERRLDRLRHLEIYKLRNTAHLKGRHAMLIGPGGIQVFPRYVVDGQASELPRGPPQRMLTGVGELDALVGGGFLERSVTLVSGSTGIGKSTLAVEFLLAGAAKGEPGLYIAREEKPDQILANADALGLPLRAAVAEGTIELLYLTSEDIRAAQLLTALTDKIQARKVRCLVLDSANQLEGDALVPGELPELLYNLAVRFKTLGVTSLFTLESRSMYSIDESLSDEGLSPVADNLIVMRYVNARGTLRSTLLVIKTRGSAHHGGTHEFRIGRGGIALSPPRAQSDS